MAVLLYRYAREFTDPENPDAPEIAQEWGEMGFDRQEALTWRDNGFHPTDASSWRDMGFTPEGAKDWVSVVGFDRPDSADMLEVEGYSPADLEKYSYQEVMALLDELIPEN